MKSEWRVTSQIINGETLYAVYRLYDKDGIDHSGQRICDRLHSGRTKGTGSRKEAQQGKFDGKPPQEQREILKKHGFRWSPTQEAWQRQLTSNAEYSIDYVIRDFNKLTDNT